MSSTDVEISRIRELTRAQHYDTALAAVEALCALTPCREALYLLAVNQRCLKRFSAALATLEKLERDHPLLGRLYQERGYCHMNLRDAPRALGAFEQAVTVNPALKESWSALESLHRIIGNLDAAATAAEQLATLEQRPPEIVRAASLFADGDVSAAERLLEHFLTRSPHHDGARLDYARVLLDRQKYAQAGAQLDLLLHRETGNAEYRALQATARAGCGDHEAAILAYQGLVNPSPEDAYLHLLLGNSLKAVGRQAEAITSYQAAAHARPHFGDAYWSLANLKTYQFSEHEIASMRAALASDALPPTDQVHLCFALGKALESREEHAESWTHYARGNALKKAERRYRPEYAEMNTQRQRAICTRDFLAARAGAGAADPSPIFIVGMPRSGSTLIEQILASHSLVEGTQELHHIPRLVEELQGYPDALPDLAPDEFRRLGERYLDDGRVYRSRGLPFFIDKMPNNFCHVGLIALVLPNAKIIDARREPMACCLSNLKQLFAGGQDFSYDQEFVARYYRTYLDLMRHWDVALPGRVLRILHEDVVADLETSVRRILEFCDLEFEPACVEFYKTKRSVSTASSEQVRQPIHRGTIDQWRHYQPWLGPLQASLGDARIRYRE